MKQGKLELYDHQILVDLIRGTTNEEMYKKYRDYHSKVARMRKLLGCRTTYQLIALEMVILLDNPASESDILELAQPKAKGATA